MKVKDIMTKNVAFVDPSTSVLETARLMQKHNVGSIPVCDKNTVVGIVTDRDIVVRNVAHGTNPQSTSARDIMTSQVQTTNPDMDTDQLSRMMADQKIRRVPVVENNTLVGIVSLGDISTQAGFSIEASEALTEISEPSKPEEMNP